MEEIRADDPLGEFLVFWDDITQEDVDSLRQCLDSAKDEQCMQSYLEQHPSMLIQHLGGGHGRWVIPQKRLGSEYTPDFVIGQKSSLGFKWTLVELESPKTRIFTKTGDTAAPLNHAKDQLQSWRAWLQENQNYAAKPRKDTQGLGLTSIDTHPDGLILIGRDADLPLDTRGLRRQYSKDLQIEIHTYDWLIRTAQERVEALALSRSQRPLKAVEQAQHALDSANPYYRFGMRSIKPGAVVISAEPKYPGAEVEHPLVGQLRFQPLETPEGQEVYRALRTHIETGAPVTISKPYLQEVELPEPLVPLLDPENKGFEMIAVGPAQTDQQLLVRMLIECEGKVKATWEHVDFRCVQAGTEEATFDALSIPWRFRLVLRKRQTQLSFTLSIAGTNAKRALEAARFAQALAEDGELRIESADTGLDIRRIPVKAGDFVAPDLHWLQLFERLTLIQAKARVPINVPDRGITQEDARAIFETASALETGWATLQINGGGFEMDREAALRMLQERERAKTFALGFETEETVDILGVKIPVGPVRLLCKRAYITDDDLEKLKADIATAGERDSVTIRFRPFEGCPVEVQYLNWLPSKPQ
jgi:hypothetical protein